MKMENMTCSNDSRNGNREIKNDERNEFKYDIL
jgi:hypothetical protein